MGLSRQEVNFRRLLAKCELMCKSRKEEDRLHKYVETLEDMFQEVKKLTNSHDAIASYKARIKAVKNSAGITTSKYLDDDPEEQRVNLLGLRQRKVAKADDVDEILNYHEDMQQRITDDMLLLTTNLKEQSAIANRVIRSDTELIGRSTELTAQNFERLNVESAKLAEHSKRACKCWMWLMLGIVMVVFIYMVLFMKVMKKKY